MAKQRKKVALPENLRGTLARNLETIKSKVPALNSQPKIAGKTKGTVGQTTVGRALRAEVPINLDNLEGLAKAVNLEPWQLLVEDLDPTNPPRLNAGNMSKDELELIHHYREASSKWRIAISYMARIKPEAKQEEAGTYMLSEIFSRPASDDQLGSNWHRPDTRPPTKK